MIVKRHKPSRMTKNQHKIEAKQDETTVYIYDYIGGLFGIDAEQFVKDFNKIDAKTIHLRIDSDGGDVFAARAMQTAIKQHKANVISHIDGLAASAAGFIAVGADEVEIVDGGFLMIHSALSFFDILGYFNADDINVLISDITKERELLHKVDEAIAKDFINKSGEKLEKIKQLMEDETWFTAKEALDIGLVDRIYEGKPIENKHDLSIYANTPEALRNENQELSKRDLESALRDAGCSRNQAKEILAKGFMVDPNEREAQEEARLQAERDAQLAADEEARLRDADLANVIIGGSTEDLLMQAEIMAPTQ